MEKVNKVISYTGTQVLPWHVQMRLLLYILSGKRWLHQGIGGSMITCQVQTHMEDQTLLVSFRKLVLHSSSRGIIGSHRLSCSSVNPFLPLLQDHILESVWPIQSIHIIYILLSGVATESVTVRCYSLYSLYTSSTFCWLELQRRVLQYGVTASDAS